MLYMFIKIYSKMSVNNSTKVKRSADDILKIQIDGIISAGKSTYISMVESYLTSIGYKVMVLQEPVALWEESGMLEAFYDNPSKYCYLFQTVALVDRTQNYSNCIKKAVEENYDVVICDRGWMSDRIFVESNYQLGALNKLEYDSYVKWSNLWGEKWGSYPDCVIWVDTNIPVCMERIKKRNRGGESKITEEYQQILFDEHVKLFDNFKNRNIDTIRVDFSEDIKRFDEVAASYCSVIIDKMKENI